MGAASAREIDRRLRSIEDRLERTGARGARKAMDTTDRVTDAVASVLGSLAERFRGISLSDETARFAEDATKIGNAALGRLSTEVEHRPLATLAVALGVGLLVGLAAHRR